MQILRDNLNHVKDFNSNGFRFFVSDLFVAIIQKDFQSLEDIFLFDCIVLIQLVEFIIKEHPFYYDSPALKPL